MATKNKHIDPATGERWNPVTNGGGRSHPVFNYLICYADGDVYDRSLGRLRKQTMQPNGYLTIYINGTMVYSHRLILEAWFGLDIFDGGKETRHRIPNPTHNWIFNLHTGTHEENMRDVIECGNHSNANKHCCPRGHALVDGNLVPSQLNIGKRSCLACDRGKSNARYQAEKTGAPLTESAILTNADRHYRRIQSALLGEIDETRLIPLTDISVAIPA